jgi:toxin ParE1/3/4
MGTGKPSAQPGASAPHPLGGRSVEARVIRRPRAVADLIDHYAYIARDRIEAAERFLRAAGQTFDLIARYPMIGRAWESDDPRLAGIRVYPMRRYRNYLVFYRPNEAGAEVR